MTKSGFDLDELERLLAAATPGEWVTDYDPTQEGDHETLVTLPGKSGFMGAWLLCCLHNWNDAEKGERRISWKEADSNAALIVKARNSLPAMIAEIRLLREENARQRGACQWIVDDPDLPKPFATYLRAALTEAAADLGIDRDKLAEVLAKRGIVGETGE